MAYVGRFAPSPTGPLHAGSLVAALASWLDARAAKGQWLVRIEDLDLPRCMPGAEQVILTQLQACGLIPDQAPLRQSDRGDVYATALDALVRDGWAYPCGCTRKAIEDAWAAQGVPRTRHAELVYPGTCRGGLQGRPARAMRALTTGSRSTPTSRATPLRIDWVDRRLGAQHQDLSVEVGDFVLHRADGLWAYQLAVVVDDAAQGISHVVRGEDLADNTPRQIHLQRALGLPTPTYLHVPLVRGPDGAKLSKQNGATPLDLRSPLAALRRAGAVLALDPQAGELPAWLEEATRLWHARWPVRPVAVNA